MISLPAPAYDLSLLRPGGIPLWQLVIAQFRLPEPTDHGATHWLRVLRNGIALCRHDEYADPGHDWRLLSTATTKNLAMQGAWHELEK